MFVWSGPGPIAICFSESLGAEDNNSIVAASIIQRPVRTAGAPSAASGGGCAPPANSPALFQWFSRPSFLAGPGWLPATLIPAQLVGHE